MAGRVRRRSHPVPALVHAGRHADVRRSRHDDAATATYTLDIAQRTPATPGQPDKLPFHIPFAVGLVDGERGATSRCASRARRRRSAPRASSTCAKRGHTFRFAGIDDAARAVAAARIFRAGEGRVPYTDGELAFLAAHDSDAVSRWDAAQRCFANAMLALARDHRDGRAIALPLTLAGIVGSCSPTESATRRCSRSR